MRKTLTMALFILLYSAPAKAIPNCRPLNAQQVQECCQRVRSAWQNEYFFTYKIDPNSWPQYLTSCSDDTYKLAEAIYYLENLSFVNAPDFRAPFRKKLKTIRYGGAAKPYGAEAVKEPLETTINPNQRKSDIVLYAGYFGANSTIAYRVGTLVHESRHFDSDDPLHVICQHGDYAGAANACDTTFSRRGAGGAFSYEVDFLVRLRGVANSDIPRHTIKNHLKDLVENRFLYVSPDDQKFFDRILKP